MDFMSSDFLLRKVLIIPAILLGFSVHEYAHAKVADMLGDNTPRMQGRLTLDPFTHMDLFGFIMILIAGIGWAKPVQVNPYNFKNKYKDDLKVNLAGPVSNLITAFIFGIISGISFMVFNKLGLTSTSLTVANILLTIMINIVSINVMLFVFNLLPIPGFDGFHILSDLSPRTFLKISDTLYRYQFIILIILIFPIFGGHSIVSLIISPIIRIITNLFITII